MKNVTRYIFVLSLNLLAFVSSCSLDEGGDNGAFSLTGDPAELKQLKALLPDRTEEGSVTVLEHMVYTQFVVENVLQKPSQNIELTDPLFRYFPPYSGIEISYSKPFRAIESASLALNTKSSALQSLEQNGGFSEVSENCTRAKTVFSEPPQINDLLKVDGDYITCIRIALADNVYFVFETPSIKVDLTPPTPPAEFIALNLNTQSRVVEVSIPEGEETGTYDFALCSSNECSESCSVYENREKPLGLLPPGPLSNYFICARNVDSAGNFSEWLVSEKQSLFGSFTYNTNTSSVVVETKSTTGGTSNSSVEQDSNSTSSSSSSEDTAPVSKDVNVGDLSEDATVLVELDYSDAEKDKASVCTIESVSNITTSDCECLFGFCTVEITGAKDYSGDASFTYSVTANSKKSNVSTGSMKFNAVDDGGPSTSNLTLDNLQEDGSVSVALPYVDPDGDLATSCTADLPSNLTLSDCACVDGDCSVSIQGAADYSGSASFRYTITAAGKTSIARTASVTIVSVDDGPPVVADVAASDLAEETTVILTLNYTDLDDDTATGCTLSNHNNLTEVTACSCTQGICSVGVQGTANYFGSASFDYTVTAGGVESNTASVTMTITNVEDPTVTTAQSVTMNEDEATIITLNYSDPDQTLADGCAVSNLSNITVSTACSCDSEGVCTVGMQGAPNYFGSSSFAYTVDMGSDTSNSSVVSLTLSPVNDAPTVENTIGDQNAITGLETAIPLASNIFSDVDDKVLTLSVGSHNDLAPYISYVSSTNTIYVDGGDTLNGAYNVDVIATDPGGAQITTSFDVNFTAATGVTAGSSSDDTQNSYTSTSVLDFYGYDGNDVVTGSFGDDILRGGVGNDTLKGGIGADTLIGGFGDDIIYPFDENNPVDHNLVGAWGGAEVDEGGSLASIVGWTFHFSPDSGSIITKGTNRVQSGTYSWQASWGEIHASRSIDLVSYYVAHAIPIAYSVWILASDENDLAEFKLTLRDSSDTNLDVATTGQLNSVFTSSTSKYNLLGSFSDYDTSADNILLEADFDADKKDLCTCGPAFDDLELYFNLPANDMQKDTMTGGLGADTFVFNAPAAEIDLNDADVITDFNARGDEGDTISFTSDVTTNPIVYNYNGAFTSTINEAILIVNGNDLVLSLDLTGSGVADYAVVLANSSLYEIDPVADFAFTMGITGTSSADTLGGTSSADVIGGGQGDDTISGLEGDDVLFGGHGNDRLEGGAGDDSLIGGTGNDTLVFDDTDITDGTRLDGGSGIDTLLIDATSGAIDFTPANNNKIYLVEAIDMSSGAHTVTINQTNLLSITDSDNTLTIDVDADDTVNLVSTTSASWSEETSDLNGYKKYTRANATAYIKDVQGVTINTP